MVLEDYGELMFLQTVLKKIGFDVDAIQNPRSFHDSVLRMNPDVLVMTAAGKKVKGLELTASLKRTRGLPHVLLIRAPGATHSDSPGVDAWLETPVAALPLLNAIGDLCGLNKDVLAAKFAKLRVHEEVRGADTRVLHAQNDKSDDSMSASTASSGNFGVLEASTLSSEDRHQRYQKFLNADRPAHLGFSIKQVQEQVKTLRKDETNEDLEELERQRKAFVEHLFKKKP